MTVRSIWLAIIAILGLLIGVVPSVVEAQNNSNAVTSEPLPPPSDLGPPPAGVSLTLPDGSPTLVPGAEPSVSPFRIGMLSDSAPGDQRRLLGPFRDHLELSLNRPVEFIPFREARGLVMAIEQRTISYAIGPGSVLATTHALCGCVEPLGTQPNADGSEGLFSVLIVQADGPVQSAEDVRADRLAIVGQGSVVAHRIGLSELSAQGVRFDTEQDVLFANSLSEAVDQLQAGHVDAVLSWTRQADGATLFASPPVHQLEDEVRSDLRIIWRSRPVLGLSHYMHDGLGEVLIGQVRDLLTQLSGTNGEAFFAVDQGSGRPFVATRIADYAPHLDALTYWSR